jgi:hypothetical protein
MKTHHAQNEQIKRRYFTIEAERWDPFTLNRPLGGGDQTGTAIADIGEGGNYLDRSRTSAKPSTVITIASPGNADNHQARYKNAWALLRR